MFGPNPTREIANIKVNYHHREASFIDLYEKLIFLFREKFSIPSQYEIFIYTGSGSLVIESFVAGFNESLKVLSNDFEREKFAKRWYDLVSFYNKYEDTSPNSMYVEYETSCSQYNGLKSNVVFTDAVSSFPYYPTPISPAWATVSSKLLGGLPVLGIFVIEKQFLDDHFDPDSPSYLNPHKYHTFQKVWQTPFTPSIFLFQDFYESLKKFDVKKQRQEIEENFTLIKDAFSGQNNFSLPEIPSPVITLPRDILSEKLIKKWQLYGIATKNNIQIFLYSEEQSLYQKLAKDIKKDLA
jgi:aspartate aminotransferase-like enzyme